VRDIWNSHGLSPHRWRQFKLSNDRAFVEKLQDVVGLYVAPSAHAVVLSVDEKSQIQALDRTQPGLPLKRGGGPTSCWKHASSVMTHDYKRNGTTTLFAALNVLDGSVIGQTMQRHRHQEFIRFPDQIERDVPKGKEIHVILDILVLAECRGAVFRQTDAAQAQARCVPVGRRPAGRHRPLHRRAQHHRGEALHLAHRPRRHHRRPKSRGPKVGFNPLERVAFIRIHAKRSNLLISHVREAQNRFPLLSNML
jgi:hypothetical protein